ncbi:MAG TPA: helix-turn-helix transcriptional regulator [Alphaproteobacteria bacterium]|nr:helix-turn-helix transcriptional regulator [Alphaproteobacteria bacterium]
MRSTNVEDYQNIPQPVAVLAKMHAAGTSTGWHSHPRGQLLYAISGLMVASTEGGTWAVPTGHALEIPPGLRHEVAMHGDVALRTAYIAPEEVRTPRSGTCRVILVSPLLDAALRALSEEPVQYDETGRGPHLAALILHEIEHASDAPFALPLPEDGRLRKLCQALIDRPSLPYDIDAWAEEVGVGRRTLTRKFRNETGLSFGEWRRRLRFLHVLKRRAEGRLPKDDAAEVGYRSAQALAVMMRRMTR